ncbi:amidase 1 [Aegilops tauschii subsp. strangulata]|uniref:Amidase domain-containing protein n=4 Tax=Aegilops tauschii TaxID=37682 RepID=A0A453DL76_AEGTS|nr:amidase 1 [Aegilops tauschii subsp. strangulata]
MEDSGDDHGAFMEKFILLPPPSSDQQQQQLPLHGLTFAIKDIFDVAGRVTGFGTPDWARTHAPAAATAPAVLAALAAGATGVGKTVMDEMAYSINGENAHYGTPANPCAPGRVPGGSSSGSAVAVAASLADFALGTDTGGSVRVPAAYCGIFGLRPSHGLVSVENVVPMAQMFDTVGWFARDLPTLSRVTDVMLPPVPAAADDDAEIPRRPSRVIIPADCFKILGSVDDHTYEILNASAAKIFGSDAVVDNGNLGDFVSSNVPSIGKFMTDLSAVEASSSCVPSLSAISRVMRVLQRSEFKANHAEWVNTVKPNLGPGIRERVQEAIASEDDSAMDDLHAVRTEFKSALAALLKDDGILAIPTVPGAPPKLRMDATLLEDFRARAFSLLSIAGLSGFCQVSIPLGTRCGVPVSVSLLARHGADRFLVAVAQELHEALQGEAAAAWGSLA